MMECGDTMFYYFSSNRLKVYGVQASFHVEHDSDPLKEFQHQTIQVIKVHGDIFGGLVLIDFELKHTHLVRRLFLFRKFAFFIDF